MFKPAKMARIRLIVHKSYFDGVMSALQDLGVLQVETLPEKEAAMLKAQESENYKTISNYAQRFRGLESLLIPMPSEEKFAFADMIELTRRADAINIDERSAAIRKEMDSIDANDKEAEAGLALLDKLDGFSKDLSILHGKNVISFSVYSAQQKQLKMFEDALAKSVPEAITIPLKNSTIFSIKSGNEKEFSAAAEGKKIKVEFIPAMEGTVSQRREFLKIKMEDVVVRRTALRAELSHLSQKYYPVVSALREQLDIEMERLEVANKLGGTESIVALEGWAPEEDVGKVEKTLKHVAHNRFILERVKTKEHPPTKMQNPAWARLSEFFIRFYSLPQSDEYDPTIMFAIAFPIFFGFMVGDVGYGLIMLIGALWLIHRLNHPPKKSRIPKAISSFVTMIVSPNGLKVLAKSIIPGAIIAIILGAIFSQYFGFSPYPPIFNTTTGLAQLLVVAGWIGVFMVEFGFFLGFLNKLHEGENKHAIAKIGWLIAGLGLVIFGLNVLHKAALGPSNLIALASYVMLAAGIISIVVFEGVQSIMELPSLISHMLSYTRLVGILLASAILAEVIDLIFIGGWHHSIILGIIGTVILIVGQLFNIAIAMFEPGIQGARLIYVEFFSKFYTGNGRQFKPFVAHRRHTLAKLKLENE